MRWSRICPVVASLALIAAACGDDDDGGGGSEAGADFQVGMILVGPQNDTGWSQAHFEAGEYVVEQLGLPADNLIVLDKVNTADRPETTVEDVAADMIDQGADIVFATSDDMKDGTRDLSARQVRAFVDRHGATFPILIGGLSDKAAATASLSLLDRVRSFPTTIFVDRRGQVRGVYQGWSGPATGATHTRLRQRFEQLIEDLLDED